MTTVCVVLYVCVFVCTRANAIVGHPADSEMEAQRGQRSINHPNGNVLPLVPLGAFAHHRHSQRSTDFAFE